MKGPALNSARLTVLAAEIATLALALAGCGRLTRVATINEVTTTPGAATAAELQQRLAKQFPEARVSCAKSMIVNVGTTTSCVLTGAGTTGTVRFTFSNSHGAIDPSSVKAS